MSADGRETMRRREWIALALAILIAHLFYWRIVVYPSEFDAREYLEIAADIDRNGLFSKFLSSDVRTYGYPLLLVTLSRAAAVAHVPVGWVVFEVQLTLYLLSALFLRRRLALLWPNFASWAFVGLALNVFALSYTPETLTESVSLSLIVFAAGFWVGFAAIPSGRWPVLAGSLTLGAAVMVRPANLFALLAWVVAVTAVCAFRRLPVRAVASVAGALVVGVALPMLPQYANNVRHYDQHTPLVAARLGHNQQVWGIANLKYATALPPVPNPSIFYDNPFAKAGPVDNEQPLAWYAQHPRAGALTLALHSFNMLDQDLLFTYSRDLDPWYRLPLGLVNHAAVAAALIGIAMLVATARRDRGYAPAAIAVCAYVVAHLLVHAPSAVEMRFGLPLLLLAGPAAIAATRELARARSRRVCTVVSAAIVVYAAAALVLSDWVRQQAPSIRAWEASHATVRSR